jgi:hypothetical protein
LDDVAVRDFAWDGRVIIVVELLGQQIADYIEMAHHYNVLVGLRVLPKDYFDLFGPDPQVSGRLVDFCLLHILKDGI